MESVRAAAPAFIAAGRDFAWWQRLSSLIIIYLKEKILTVRRYKTNRGMLWSGGEFCKKMESVNECLYSPADWRRFPYRYSYPNGTIVSQGIPVPVEGLAQPVCIFATPLCQNASCCEVTQQVNPNPSHRWIRPSYLSKFCKLLTEQANFLKKRHNLLLWTL